MTPREIAQEAIKCAIEGADNGDGTFDLVAFEESLLLTLEEHWQAAQAEVRREEESK